jgi:aryl-alcohol dehydrogenase-like predicted oxidoreductase
MNYRDLGKTGLKISEVGFGCGNIGGLMVRGTFEEQVAAVTRAVELGINYFDTAPDYGGGMSEANLGKVLAHLKPDVRVGTKVRVSPEDLPGLDRFVTASVETSLTRLGREHVDLLQLHTPIMAAGQGLTPEDILGTGGVADVFEELRARGLARFLGITGLGDTTAIRTVIESRRFDTVQAYYNLLNPSAGRAVPAGFGGQDFGNLISVAGGLGMGVIVIRVMAGGALGGASARNGYASPTVGGALAGGSEYEKDERRAGTLRSLAGDEIPLSQATVRFALMAPHVSTVLVGYSDIPQIEAAVGAAAQGPLPANFMERLEEAWTRDVG